MNCPSLPRLRAFPAVAVLALSLAASCRPHAGPGATPERAPGTVLQPVPTVGIIPAALTPAESAVRDAVATQLERHVALLGQAVNIASGTTNHAGVRAVGALFAREFEALGFTTRWVSLPDSLHRAGHLVAEHPGNRGLRLLLIGHLDTVFEGENQRWVREDTVARGAGATDMKGGDVAMLLALRALADAGQLADMHVTVVMTGDEELPARPLSVARAALIDAAKASDLALAFEGGSPTRVAIGRRGTSQWTLQVRARQAHSSGIFAQGVGYGAVYEGVRIIDEWRRTMAGERGLTFNVGLLGGGERVQLDSTGNALAASGKDNIIPPTFVASGDLRFLRDAQRDSARARMQAIVARAPLPGATAELRFEEGYPAMAVTAQNERLLAIFDGASRALGYPAVGTTAPENRGAGDVSFVAPYIPGIDGLGTDGRGSHSPEESVSLPSLRMAAERAALFMARLAREWPRGAM